MYIKWNNSDQRSSFSMLFYPIGFEYPTLGGE